MGERVDVPGPDGCPLPRRQQTRNLLLFAACTGANYLAGPVTYVGLTQASLCHRLGASDKVANLPEALYLGMTVAPVLVAWWLPSVRMLKRSLVTCYALAAAAAAAVALVLPLAVPDAVKVAAVVWQGAALGAAMPTAIAFLWEAVGRGVAEARRGHALGLAFGAGPLLAVAGSLGAPTALGGDPEAGGLAFPWNYVVVFAAAVPVLGLAAVLAGFLVVPPPEHDAVRQPFVRGVFGGLSEFLADRVLRTATVVTILLYTGNTIASNLNLYTKEVLGADPSQYAGLQNAVRFGAKVAAGLVLGWLLTRTHPKAGVLATGAVFTAAVVWALLATGRWYLAAFALYGAGELVGVYAPNYILSASRPAEIRRSMAFVTMMMAPAAPAGYLFGAISDHFGAIYGKAVGFRASFAVCTAIMAVGIIVAVVALPARPRAGRDGPTDRRGKHVT